MTTRVTDITATGIHSARPAANAVPTGSLYSCTTHSLIYKTDGSTWSTWATLGAGGAVPAAVSAAALLSAYQNMR